MPLLLSRGWWTLCSELFWEALCWFFYDILIYRWNLVEHLGHFRSVLGVLKQYNMYAKMSKCKFAMEEVDYLGHVIFGCGVSRLTLKIVSMKEWPIPTSLKALRGFLGLTGYYRKFIRIYGTIAAPLTVLLKKNSFNWTAEASRASQQLKNAITAPPVLKLPDFSKSFTIECDASRVGLRVLLIQEGQPIAFYSKALKGNTLLLSSYEKELLALVSAVSKWRPY